MTKAEVIQLVGRKEDHSGTTHHYGESEPPPTWKSYMWLDDDGILTVHFDEERMVVTDKDFASWSTKGRIERWLARAKTLIP